MAAIDYDTLFTRLGKIGHVGYLLAGYESNLPAALTDIWTLYENTADNDLIGNLMAVKDTIPAPTVTAISTISSLATSTLVRMVAESVPSISQFSDAMIELIRQMKVDSQTVKACTVTATSSALSTNIGNGVLVLSTKRGDGLVQENIIAEEARLQCDSDSYTGGQTAGQEPFVLTGVPSTAGLWEYNYPTGSGASQSTNAISADQDGVTTGNLTTNGDMEVWTGSPAQLSNWTIGGGASWGTQLVQNNTTTNRGTYSLEWVAGATNTSLYQQFNDTTNGTGANVTPLYSYAVNFWLRKKSGTISGGVLTVELVDGSGTVINDQQGTANSFTVTLSTVPATWTAYNGLFRIPEVPPSVIRLRFRLSTALAGANLLMDDACCSQLVASYPGGYGFQVFSGSSPFVTGDGWNVTSTNNRGGSTYLATFQSLFNRFFDMAGSGFLLPSTSGVPTQPDTKITV